MGDFTVVAYRAMLQTFTDANYVFCSFEDIDQHLQKESSCVVLRHDIDISLLAALEIAHVEHDLGIQATYFVGLTSPFYNVLSGSSGQILAQIHELGHHIALHLDIRPYNDNFESALAELTILSSFYPYINIHLISLHSPIALYEAMINSIEPLKNVYGHFFAQQMAYCSDSTGRWRYGHPTDSDAFYSRKPIQLLTHPIWWTQDGETPLQKLEFWFRNQRFEMQAAARAYLPKLYNIEGL